jgi:hypothetical protein
VLIHLSKIDVVERQLGAAIELHFARGDVVAIFTLACAAHQVLRDLAQDRKVEPQTFRAKFARLRVTPEQHKQFFKDLALARNFCNHANDDPNRSLQLNPATAEWEMLDGVLLHRQLTGASPAHFDAFEAWWVARNPDIADDLNALSVEQILRAAQVDTNRGGFLAGFLEGRLRQEAGH